MKRRAHPNRSISNSTNLDEDQERLVRQAATEKWLAANRKAIEAYNARIEREGVWSDKLRGF